MSKILIFFLALGALIGSLIYFKEPLLISYADFFHKQNAKKGADALVILAGSPTTRANRAIELYKDGYAKEVLITSLRPPLIKYADIQKPQTVIIKEILQTENISPVVVPSLKGGATSTFDEAYDLAKYCKDNNLSRIIIVTDEFHTARSYYAFSKIFDKEDIKTKLQISGAKNDIFNVQNWWQNEAGLMAYITEGMKYIYYAFSDKNMEGVKEE